jgi:hypothetical protein
MKFDDICNSILERVFHGTPHDVGDKFDLNKVGSGEGAQVYGWGLYFAENPDVAQDYRKNLSGYDELTIVTDKGKKKGHQLDSIDMEAAKYLEVGERIAGQFKHNTVYYAKKEAEKDGKNDVIARIDEYGRDAKVTWEKNLGNLYEVDIDADKENDFLDWDKPLSEQSENVKKALSEYIDFLDRWQWSDEESWKGIKDMSGLGEKSPIVAFDENQLNALKKGNGQDIYYILSNYYSSKKEASEYLKLKGIKGIKYLDQGSRKNPAWENALKALKGYLIDAMRDKKVNEINSLKAEIEDLKQKIAREGTYNYVIFDPSIIKIVAKNGEFVMNSKKPENIEI